MSRGPLRLRPLEPRDVPGLFDLCESVLFGQIPQDEHPDWHANFHARVEHLCALDPGGAWVAEIGEVPVGCAVALVREGIWGLSLLAVDAAAQGQGAGRLLLDAALAYGDACDVRGALIAATSHPAAARLYARAGFALHPSLSACGIPDLGAMPEQALAVREVGSGAIALADTLTREQRGGGNAADVERMLDAGLRLLAYEDRAVALVSTRDVRFLAARDDAAAATVLWAALAAMKPGATAEVGFLTAGQQWAVRTCLDARLALSPDGPICTRGTLGPLTPYLPSGAYL